MFPAEEELGCRKVLAEGSSAVGGCQGVPVGAGALEEFGTGFLARVSSLL